MNPLARAREHLGFTQSEMAHELGLSLRTYQRRETLKESEIPRAELIAAFALTSECAKAILSNMRKRNPLLEA